MTKLHILATEGHRAAVFDDESPEDRGRLAQEVGDLMQKGFTCFLRQDDEEYKIVGYDLLNNAWLTQLSPRSGTSLVPVKSDDVVTGVPAIAGG